MKVIITLIIVLFGISFLIAILYALYMGSKREQYPKVDFTRFEKENNNVKEVETLINKAIKGVNGWMWLATAFMALHYFMNFWSIVFMLLNIIVVAYQVENNKEILLFLVSGSLLFTCIDLWINTKEKSNMFHRHWFKTSAKTKEYIVAFAKAETFDEICKLAKKFNEVIYEENKKVKFL